MTPKQENFVREYLIDLNATQAAIRAGYSKKTAEKIGSENLKKPEIAQALAAQMKKRQEAVGLSAERVLLELARIVTFDPRKLFGDDGMPIHISSLDDDTAAAICGIEVVTIGNAEQGLGQITKYKISDKNSAITNAMRHLGLLKDKLEVSGSVKVGQLLSDVRKRINGE